MIKYPEWFKFELGFKFLDNGGDECVYLGEAGFRSFEIVGHVSLNATKDLSMQSKVISEVVMQPQDSWVFVYKYKGEWHFSDLKRGSDYNQDWWNCIRPWDHVGPLTSPVT